MAELALFPLRQVLFPQMPLRLHVFEPRYLALLHECRSRAARFGVVAIRSGSEVGGEAESELVGTEAVITEDVPLSAGRARLTVTGARRFRILARVSGTPFPRARVEYLAETEPDPAAFLLVGEAQRALERYVERLSQLVRRPAMAGGVPSDPLLLSWVIGSALMVELAKKQRLLEQPGAGARLREEIALLRREAALLDLEMAARVQFDPTYDRN